MDTDGIIIQKSEQGKLIGAAKRVWVAAKKEIVKLDNIEKNEAALFVNDTELARLAKAKEIIDEQITAHINNTLIDYRGYDAVELAEKKQAALLELLKDAKKELEELYDNVEVGHLPTENVIGRLGNMIKDLEGAE